MDLDVAFAVEDGLGEAPSWDPATGTLLWVDVPGDRIHRGDPRTGAFTTVPCAGTVSAVVPRAAGGLVGATDHGFAEIHDDGAFTVLAPLDLPRDGMRMNDGKCDPQGRFWAGSMARAATPHAGTLYRLDQDHTAHPVLGNLSVSNGLGWSPDGAHMYFIDTADQGVDEVVLDGGGVASRRRLVNIEREHGVPDGMTVDAEGLLWVVMAYGGQVRRYSPDGRLDRVVRLPVTFTTSAAFGGADLAQLFITTGAERLSAAERAEQPLAGSVFVCTPGVRGLPAAPYAG
jgi:sugar lactone lactonase YvrE